MKQQKIPMQKEMIVHSIVILFYIVSVISCRTPKERTSQIQKDEYGIIEKVNYGENGLYYRTLSYDELPATHLFSYDQINKENVKYNSITEKGRFVNFDTIFNQEQRQEINSRLKNLRSRKLKPAYMANPKVLSEIRTPYGTPLDEQQGRNSVTFPVIVNSAEGVPFGFIYRNSSGLLHIYKKEKNNWQEFARVEIHLM